VLDGLIHLGIEIRTDTLRELGSLMVAAGSSAPLSISQKLQRVRPKA
jgi:hypothetical protein